MAYLSTRTYWLPSLSEMLHEKQKRHFFPTEIDLSQLHVLATEVF